MFSGRIQQRARYLVTVLIKPLARLGISPNTLTIIGLLFSFVTAGIIAQGYLSIGGWLVLFAGIFDMFDGAMARVRNAATTFGAFLDSTLDRFSEAIILLGLLLFALQHPGLHDSLWPAGNEQAWMISLVYISAVGSLMVSYTKARAEGLGIECKTGLLARPERVILLAVGLLTGTAIWTLALLALFSNVTAVERIFAVWLSIRRQSLATRSTALTASEQVTSTEHLHLSGVITTNEAQSTEVRPVSTSVPPFTGSIHPE